VQKSGQPPVHLSFRESTGTDGVVSRTEERRIGDQTAVAKWRFNSDSKQHVLVEKSYENSEADDFETTWSGLKEAPRSLTAITNDTTAENNEGQVSTPSAKFDVNAAVEDTEEAKLPVLGTPTSDETSINEQKTDETKTAVEQAAPAETKQKAVVKTKQKAVAETKKKDVLKTKQKAVAETKPQIVSAETKQETKSSPSAAQNVAEDDDEVFYYVVHRQPRAPQQRQHGWFGQEWPSPRRQYYRRQPHPSSILSHVFGHPQHDEFCHGGHCYSAPTRRSFFTQPSSFFGPSYPEPMFFF
jgi:hypothetical protein